MLLVSQLLCIQHSLNALSHSFVVQSLVVERRINDRKDVAAGSIPEMTVRRSIHSGQQSTAVLARTKPVNQFFLLTLNVLGRC